MICIASSPANVAFLTNLFALQSQICRKRASSPAHFLLTFTTCSLKFETGFSLSAAADDDDELFFLVWLTDERRLALFPSGTIVRVPHHRESPTCREQDLNLSSGFVE